MAIPLYAQSDYVEIKPENGSPFLLGEIPVEALQKASYSTWFNTNYNTHSVDESLVNLFKKKLKNHEILLFLGTWCGDSKREVPKILKILDAAHFPPDQLKLVALDKRRDTYKKGLHGEEKGWNITRVPTLILLNKGKEVNRIVEQPLDTWEEDLLAILNGMEYTPNYAN